MPRSQLTGTQKKAQKKLAKTQAELSEFALKDVKRQRPFQRETRRELLDLIKGKGLPETSLKQLTKDFERAGRGAEKIFEPIRERALRDFDQNVNPTLATQFGQGTAGSSAMNQALAAARGNLQQNLAADFSSLQSNLASDLLNKRYQSQVAALNAKLSGSGQFLGQTAQPQFSGALSSPYLQKQGGTSGIGGELIGGGLGALGSYLGAGGTFGLGSSTAAAAAPAVIASSSRDVKENIREYDKGLEMVRDFDVKQYDYIIPVVGNRNDRVGLIAEEMPEEIRTMVGDIRSVDVYGLVCILVNCVKQLDMKVKKLEEK